MKLSYILHLNQHQKFVVQFEMVDTLLLVLGAELLAALECFLLIFLALKSKNLPLPSLFLHSE